MDGKLIAIVTLARHGQELGARVVGPEILHYLIGDDAREIRDTQVVIVVPVVNPEGFVLNEFHSSRTSLTKTERFVLGHNKPGRYSFKRHGSLLSPIANGQHKIAVGKR